MTSSMPKQTYCREYVIVIKPTYFIYLENTTGSQTKEFSKTRQIEKRENM